MREDREVMGPVRFSSRGREDYTNRVNCIGITGDENEVGFDSILQAVLMQCLSYDRKGLPAARPCFKAGD